MRSGSITSTWSGGTTDKDFGAADDLLVGTAAGNAPASGGLHWNLGLGYNGLVCLNEGKSGQSTGAGINIPFEWAGTFTLVGEEGTVPTPCGNLTVRPSIEDYFSMGRVTSASLSVWSSGTTSGSQFPTGSFAGVATNDIRGVTSPDYGDLKQQAITRKDFKVATRAEGVTCIVGPDVPGGMQPVDYGYVSFNGIDSKNEWISTGRTGTGTDSNDFISATGFHMLGTSTSYQTPTMAPYFCGATLSVVLECTGPAGPVYISTVPIYFKDSWNGVTPIQYYSGDTRKLEVNIATGSTTIDTFDIEKPQLGWMLAGIAVRTATSSAYVKQYGYSVKNLYENAVIGSHRLVFWNNVGAGQSLTYDFKGIVDGVATGITTTLKKAEHTSTWTVQDWDGIKTMFADPSCIDLARVYTKAEFERILLNGVRITCSPGNGPSLQASGILSSIGGLLGGMLGGSKGRSIGSSIGDIGELALGAEGMFGADGDYGRPPRKARRLEF